MEEVADKGQAEGETGSRRGEILVVEDTPASLLLLSELLAQAGYSVRQASNGELALWTVEASLPDLILLDINMPGIDGFEVCRRLKADPVSREVPVIFLSALFDVADIVGGLELGAVDFIAKPYVPEEVLARVRTHVELARARRQLQLARDRLEERVRERTAELEATTAALRLEMQGRLANEEKLRLAGEVFEASFDGILVLDFARNIRLANPAFTRLTGYEPALLRGQTLGLLDSDKNEAGFFNTLWQRVMSKGYWSGEIWLRHQDSNVFPALATFSAIRNPAGEVTSVVALFVSVAERRDAETLIAFLSRHDPLTGLPNRVTATAAFECLRSRNEHGDGQMAVLCVDLDRFKAINEVMGHAAGDRVLQQVSDRIGECLAPDDIIYRQGADEFVVIRADRGDLWSTRELIQKILLTLNRELQLDEGRVSIAASIGVASAPQREAELVELVRNAGTALSRAKSDGGNTFAFFASEMDAATRSSYDLQIRLRDALAGGQLEIFLQPQIELASGRLVGAEALLRWKDPEQGYIPPGVFIPVAEETGQIEAIGAWVLDEVCRLLASWRQAGLNPPKVAVNVSARQFRHQDLCALVEQALAAHAVPADRLEIEITEGAMVEDVGRAIETLERLKVLGVQLSLDDFGTGYSSLAYLKRFPLDVLKIDQSFIRDMLADPAAGAIVRSIITLAHNLRLRVIAEGVEREAEAAFLHGNACDEVQGYFFARPMPAADFCARLQAGGVFSGGAAHG